jgi:hypothetical protein
MDIVLDFIIGIVGFIVGGWFVPYYKYFLEKKKTKIEERKKLILELRTEISNTDWSNNRNFLKSANYMRIRKFLTPEFITDLEPGQETVKVMVGSPRSYYDNKFYQELDRIEKEWVCGID